MICLWVGYGLPSLQHPTLVDRFYRERNEALFWFAGGENGADLRRQLLLCIDSAAWQGLDSNLYHPGILRACKGSVAEDRLYTDVAFAYASDVMRGYGIDRLLSYDGVAPTRAGQDEQVLLKGLGGVATASGLRDWFAGLQVPANDYAILAGALQGYLDSASALAAPRIRQLSATLNVLRYMRHYRFDRYIVVNIPSATLSYYDADTLALQMKVVAGQPSKRTPRFAAFCTRLILYPYWNIPRGISVREMLPLFKRNPGLASLLSIEALDGRGRMVDIETIQWGAYTAATFPYTLRQAPGCENALGVLKFDINSPYDVYMHDTNLKSAFASSRRYFSHGCIRLERPLDLGMRLLGDRLDTAYLRSCLKDQKPAPVGLLKPVPVFVVYLTAGVTDSGQVAWYKDVYHLVK